MHVSVTALGAPANRVRAAARNVVDYLEGRQANDLTRPGSGGDAKPILAQEAGAGAYYSDSAERPGRWRGAGTGHLGATVWERKSWKLFAIDAGYSFVSLVVVSVILTHWL